MMMRKIIFSRDEYVMQFVYVDRAWWVENTSMDVNHEPYAVSDFDALPFPHETAKGLILKSGELI